MNMTITEALQKCRVFCEAQLRLAGDLSSNSYFVVDHWFIELWSDKEKNEIEKFIKLTPVRWEFGFWKKFVEPKKILYFQELKRRRKMKSLQFGLTPLHRRIDINPFKKTKIHDAKTFLSLASRKGIFVPMDNLYWYRENQLIKPIYIKNGIDYYTIPQIYELDLLHTLKLRSLESAEHMALPDRGIVYKPVIGWQEYILMYKDTLMHDAEIDEMENMYKVILFIEDYYSFSLYQVGKRNRGKPIRNTLYQEQLNMYQDELVDKIYSEVRIREGVLNLWMNKMVNKALHHNPMFEQLEMFPAMLRMFEKKSNNSASSYQRFNHFALANFYFGLARKLLFFYNGTKKKNVNINELFRHPIANTSREHLRLCENPKCGQSFVPRIGGRPQVVCGKKECRNYKASSRATKRDLKKKNERHSKKITRLRGK